MTPVCLVLGAGAGIGGNVARRFAQAGYHAVLCRRCDQAGLNRLVDTIRADGNAASGFLVNAIEPNSIEELVATIEADIGPIEVAVYNLGAQIGERALANTSLKAFETGWRIGTLGLFRLASALCPTMQARGKGTLLVTSSTAALRGNGGQHSHAAGSRYYRQSNHLYWGKHPARRHCRIQQLCLEQRPEWPEHQHHQWRNLRRHCYGRFRLHGHRIGHRCGQYAAPANGRQRQPLPGRCSAFQRTAASYPNNTALRSVPLAVPR